MKRKVHKYNWLCILSCILAILAELLVVLNSVLLGRVMDAAAGGNLAGLLGQGAWMIGILLMNNVIFTVSVYLNLQFSNLKTVDLRIAVVRNLLRKPLWSVQKEDEAFYSNILYGDIDKLNLSVYQNYSIEWKFLTLFLASLGMIAHMNLLLFFSAVVFCILPMAATLLLQKTVNKQGAACSACDEDYQRRVTQIVQGFPSVKMSANPMAFASRFFFPASVRKGKAYVKKESIQTIAYGFVDWINSLGQFVLIMTGGYLILRGTVTTGTLVSCMMLSSYVYSGLNNFLETFLERKSYNQIQQKVESAANEETVPADGCKCPKTEGGAVLQYDHVSFAFGEKRILDDFSYTFEAGKCYCISGESGIGKTTLMQLALKYYENFAGKITLDGVDIRLLNDQSMYDRVGYLNQAAYIFQDTIENNILMYAPEGKISEDILGKCRLTELEKRLQNETVGSMGEKLSGGERKRVALARVFFRNPELMILDEPTSEIDGDNAQAIMEAVFSMNGVTRIVVSHDEAIVRDARFDGVILLS